MQFFDNIENSSMYSIIKMQHFWHHRKFVNASDRFNVKCNFLTILEIRQCIRSSKCSFFDKIRKPVNASDCFRVKCNFLTNTQKTRQCIWLFQRQMQFFDKTRQFVNASDCFKIRCSFLTKTRKLANVSDVSALDAARRKPNQTANQHLNQHLNQYPEQHHPRPANVASAQARLHSI